ARRVRRCPAAAGRGADPALVRKGVREAPHQRHAADHAVPLHHQVTRCRGGGRQAVAGVASASLAISGSASRVTRRSTKKAAVGTVPASSTHSWRPTGIFILLPRSKAKIRYSTYSQP